jgi:D-serine deaminase-like pyridoxal phosphate-dependent protein
VSQPVSSLAQPPANPLPADLELPVTLADTRIATPAVVVDLDILGGNITRMAAVARRVGVALRPHIKSHKSIEIAHRQLAAGSTGVCVATVGEAEVMWAGGIRDITLAYPVWGAAKLARLRDIVTDGAITLVTDSVEVAEGYHRLAVEAGRDVPVLVEIDTGMHRVGVPTGQVVEVARRIAGLPGIHFNGILTHAGHAHDVVTQPQIAAVARDEARQMAAAREALEAAGLPVAVVSAGSTLTAPYLSAADGITEIRPGTYVYNDLRTLGCYACAPDQLAATVLTTVVSVGDGRAVLDAGSKTLTTSRTEHHGFGYPDRIPEARIVRLSEEHAVLQVPDGTRPSVGDRLRMLPIHVCVWMDLQREVYGISGDKIVSRVTVDAMRRSL